MVAFKKMYEEKIVPELIQSRGYKNKLQVPRLQKIVINMGVGVPGDRDELKSVVADLARITLRGSDETIPTLPEVLALVAGVVPVLIEIKDQSGALGPVPGVERGAVVSFTLAAAHPHDVVAFADQYGLALRGGHHCNQPLMRRFKVPSTVRASFYFYNSEEEVDRLVEVMGLAVDFFGG
jgi:hypothetical protein